MTPPETSDQGNMVSQRQGEWVLVPKHPTHAMKQRGSDALKAVTAGSYDFAHEVWDQMLSAAPPPEPCADEGGSARSQPIFGSVPLPTREAVRPVRVQLKRTKGWKMPPSTEKVDRSTGWGNPWIAGNPGRVKLHNGDVVRIGPAITTDGAVLRFRLWMQGEMGFHIGQYVRHRLFDAVLCPGAPPNASFLRGKNLACWCKPGEPCHADVLLELANDGRANGGDETP